MKTMKLWQDTPNNLPVETLNLKHPRLPIPIDIIPIVVRVSETKQNIVHICWDNYFLFVTKYRYYDQKLSCLFLSKIVWTWRLTGPSSQERHLTSHICIKLARCCHVTAPPSHGGKSAAPAPGLWEERGGHVMPHLARHGTPSPGLALSTAPSSVPLSGPDSH